MGPVSIYLRELVAKQVREHGIVVWYDPEKHYGEFVKDLAIPDTTVARYCGSFFELRREVEPLIGGLQRPRLIVSPWRFLLTKQEMLTSRRRELCANSSNYSTTPSTVE